MTVRSQLEMVGQKRGVSPSLVDAHFAEFGKYLSRQRQLRSLRVREVGEYCKFHVEDIQALEAGRLDHISKQVAIRELIQAYAEAIGLLPDDVLLRYEEAEGHFQASAQKLHADRQRRGRRFRGAIWLWGTGALFVGAAAYAFASGRLTPLLK